MLFVSICFLRFSNILIVVSLNGSRVYGLFDFFCISLSNVRISKKNILL